MPELGINLTLRCDSCNAQAFAAATKDDMMLLFCGHHARRHADALSAAGWTTTDNSHLINEQPSVSANV